MELSRQPRLAVSASSVKASTISGMKSVAPMSRRSPVATSPRPMIITPSPGATHPDVTRCGANRSDFNYGCRQGRRQNDRSRCHHRGRSHYNWDWQRDSDVDSETKPSVDCGDSCSCQGQNCDSLFHNSIDSTHGVATSHYKCRAVL